ncbi:hypothetical protein J4234_02600 [Candidatus Woesearchaeota archaeon]|nr:hypothetical protein [Candidatus Woesearchaeota archaeon]
MKLYRQFDLNLNALNVGAFRDINMPKAINEIPALVEKLIKDLLKDGYIVIESSAHHMGIPRSITVVRDFTGPFATKFSAKIQHDFNTLSNRIGVERLFE